MPDPRRRIGERPLVLPAVFRYANTIWNIMSKVLRWDAPPSLGAGWASRGHDQPAAVHRTILIVDVEGFGDRQRTNAHRLVVRRSLYQILEQVFDKVGVTWAGCDLEDRGDGVLVLVNPTIAKTTVVESLPNALVMALRAHNGVHCPEEQIRLRMSVHAGEIYYDEHGVVGEAVNVAFRLLDSQVLRDALARSAHPLAMIASSWFYDEVIWHSRTAEPETYRQVRVSSKETDVMAWIRLPPRGR